MLYSINSVRYDDIGAVEFIENATKIIQNSVDATREEGAERKGSTYYRRHFTAGDLSFVMFGLQGFRSDVTGAEHSYLHVKYDEIQNTKYNTIKGVVPHDSIWTLRCSRCTTV